MRKTENRPVKKAQIQHQNDFFPEEDPGFSFVAGYTSWGFPYGTYEEDEEDTALLEEEDLPF